MPFQPSLKRGDIGPAQRVICPACNAFVEVVGGIRGPAFEEEGRRHFYTVQGPMRRSRCGPRYGVSPTFFRGVSNACEHWLVDHLADEVDPSSHLARQQLPSWVLTLIRDVDFSDYVGRDVAVTVCAKLLGISRQQVYAQLA